MPILKLRMKNAANYCAAVWQMHVIFCSNAPFFKHFDKMVNHMTEICCKYFNENRCATRKCRKTDPKIHGEYKFPRNSNILVILIRK